MTPNPTQASDESTRKVIRLASKQAMTHREALYGAVVALGLAASAGVWILGEARGSSDEAKASAAAVALELRQVREDVRGVYRYLLTREPQPRLEVSSGGPP